MEEATEKIAGYDVVQRQETESSTDSNDTHWKSLKQLLKP